MTRRAGYTLIEMISVIAIMGILLSIMVSFGGDTRKQIALQTEGARIIQLVSRAQSMAMSVRRGNAGDPTCGYEVRIDYAARKIHLEKVKTNCDTKTGGVLEDVGGSPFDLDGNVSFGTVDNAAKLERIIFVPPEPVIHRFNAQDDTEIAGTAKVPLKAGNGSTLDLLVSSAGQITF